MFHLFFNQITFFEEEMIAVKKLSLNSSNTQRKTLGYKLAKPNFLYM